MLERFPKNAHAAHRRVDPGAVRRRRLRRGPSSHFLDDHPLASGPRRVAQSIERLGVNVAFADRERGRAGRQPLAVGHRCR